jgi:hypothetical protein
MDCATALDFEGNSLRLSKIHDEESAGVVYRPPWVRVLLASSSGFNCYRQLSISITGMNAVIMNQESLTGLGS